VTGMSSDPNKMLREMHECLSLESAELLRYVHKWEYYTSQCVLTWRLENGA